VRRFQLYFVRLPFYVYFNVCAFKVVPLHISVDATESQTLDNISLEYFSKIAANGPLDELMNNALDGALDHVPNVFVYNATSGGRRVLSSR